MYVLLRNFSSCMTLDCNTVRSQVKVWKCLCGGDGGKMLFLTSNHSGILMVPWKCDYFRKLAAVYENMFFLFFVFFPFACRSCTTSSRQMISLQNSPKGFLWGNINRVHRRELPRVTAEYIRSSHQSGRNKTLVAFDTADFTGLLLWITGLTLYTELSSPRTLC